MAAAQIRFRAQIGIPPPGAVSRESVRRWLRSLGCVSVDFDTERGMIRAVFPADTPRARLADVERWAQGALPAGIRLVAGAEAQAGYLDQGPIGPDLEAQAAYCGLSPAALRALLPGPH